jgi:hypothetical protein
MMKGRAGRSRCEERRAEGAHETTRPRSESSGRIRKWADEAEVPDEQTGGASAA